MFCITAFFLYRKYEYNTVIFYSIDMACKTIDRLIKYFIAVEITYVYIGNFESSQRKVSPSGFFLRVRGSKMFDKN